MGVHGAQRREASLWRRVTDFYMYVRHPVIFTPQGIVFPSQRIGKHRSLRREAIAPFPGAIITRLQSQMSLASRRMLPPVI